VEMTAVRASSSLATITCLPSLPGICQSTIVLVASMSYCTVIAFNTHMNRMAN
jgi:endonuclease III